MAHIDDALLDHLCALARIEPERDSDKRQKLKKDLGALLDYFAQLNEVNTTSVEPLTGGTLLLNHTRSDTPGEVNDRQHQLCVDQFPQKEHGYLKVPGVFRE